MALPVTVTKRGIPVTIVGGNVVSLGPDGKIDPTMIPFGSTGDPAGPLGADGRIPASQLPPLEHDSAEAATEAEMLALEVSAPAICIRTDFSPAHVYYLHTDPPTTLANWADTGQFGGGAGDPAATIGLTAKNGVSNNYMRADGAPALDQSIAPTWTGPHKFTGVSTAADSTLTVRSTTPRLEFSRPDQPDRLMFEYTSSETLTVTYTNAAGDPVLSPLLINPAVVAVVDAAFKCEFESTADDASSTVVADAPQFDIKKNNGAADAKRWIIDGGTANTLTFNVVNDAGTTRNPYLTVVRSGSAVTSVTFGNTTNNPAFLWAGNGPWTVGGNTGTAGQVLTSNGNAAAPAWTSHFPIVVAQDGKVAQTANFNAPNIYTVPVSGVYRVSSYIVLTQAATTSATLPGVNVAYTEAQTGSALQDILSTSATANVVGTHNSGSVVISAQQGSGISYSTSNYASAGATSMAYRVNIVIERLS